MDRNPGQDDFSENTSMSSLFEDSDSTITTESSCLCASDRSNDFEYNKATQSSVRKRKYEHNSMVKIPLESPENSSHLQQTEIVQALYSFNSASEDKMGENEESGQKHSLESEDSSSNRRQTNSNKCEMKITIHVDQQNQQNIKANENEESENSKKLTHHQNNNIRQNEQELRHHHPSSKPESNFDGKNHDRQTTSRTVQPSWKLPNVSFERRQYRKLPNIFPNENIKAKDEKNNIFTIQVKESNQAITESHLNRALNEVLNKCESPDSVSSSQRSHKSSMSYETKLTFSIKIHQDQDKEKDSDRKIAESNSEREMLKEIAMQTIDLNVATCSQDNKPFSLITKLSFGRDSHRSVPVLLIKSPSKGTSTTSKYANTTTPRTTRAFASMSSLVSAASTKKMTSEPQSLLFQALAKLNEKPVKVTELNGSARSTMENLSSSLKVNTSKNTTTPSPELSPPDSLTSAPPSYSFVLRQSAIQARPRLMGTFIPSPSFVQTAPPPNYAQAFDIYTDYPLPVHTTPTRVYNFGFTEMPVVCPTCGYTGLTVVISKVTLYTHLCSCLLCIFCCWICAPLPYLLRSCKDVYHYCRNCRNLLGMYRPSNAETSYSVAV